MHRLGDVVQVRLVEAAPVAGALRFELLSEGSTAPRGSRFRDSRVGRHAGGKTRPGRDKKDGKTKSRKPSRGKARKPKKG